MTLTAGPEVRPAATPVSLVKAPRPQPMRLTPKATHGTKGQPAQEPWVVPAFSITGDRPTRSARRRAGRAYELVPLFVIAAVLYAWTGWWLAHTEHFVIGDALSRTLDATNTLWSRDPHFASVGVYWMPLPTYAQIPLAAICKPLGIPAFAGPLSTAFFGAGTLVVIAEAGRGLGLNRASSIMVAMAYGLNPVVIYYAANGMSESCEFFFLALSLWGLLRYLQDGRSGSALLSGMGLACLALSKNEAPPIVVVILAAVLLNFGPRLRRRSERQLAALDFTLFAMPPFIAYAWWLGYNKLLLGSFTAFLSAGAPEPVHVKSDAAAPPGDIVNARHSASGTAAFLIDHTLAFAPALLLVIPLLLLRRRRTVGGIAILGSAAAAVTTITVVAYIGSSTSDPRYFTPLIPITTIGIIWAGCNAKKAGAIFATPIMIAAIVFGAITGTVEESNAATSNEGESRIFSGAPIMLGSEGDVIGNNQQTADEIDSLLQPGQHVIEDVRATGVVDLLSRKSRQFIVNADRDYPSIVDPSGSQVRIEYAIVAETGTFKAGGVDAVRELLGRQQGWTEIWHNTLSEIWQRSPSSLTNLPLPRY